MTVKAIFSLILIPIALMTMQSSLVKAESFKFPEVKPDPNPLRILTPVNEQFTFIKTGATTCQKYAMVEAIIPPGVGPLPHIHHFHDEWFYFPEGGITLGMSMESSPDINVVPGINAPKQILHLVKTTPGSLFYGARFYMHGFSNTSNSPKKVIMVWSPDDKKVGMSSFFNEVGQHILSDKIPPVNQKNRELLLAAAPKYGMNQSSSPDQYVSGTDYNFPHHGDNHEQELLSLLNNDGKCDIPKASTNPSPSQINLTSTVPSSSQINLTSTDVNLVPELTTNLATKLALTAVNSCAAKGIPVSATVVNKEGVKQVVIRGNNAPPHTVDFSYSKAYSVVTLAGTQKDLNTTREMAERFVNDPVRRGVLNQPGIFLSPGGIVIRNANNEVIAGLGVAGAANPKDEESCAMAGLNEIKIEIRNGK